MFNFNIRFYLFALFLWGIAGCDLQPTVKVVHPTIRVFFQEPITKKSAENWVIALDIKTPSGTSYSPPAQTVSVGANYADFEVSLPADSTFRFTATYTLGSVLRAEGSTLQTIRVDTKSVSIPVNVLPPNTEIPFIGTMPTFTSVSQSQVPTVPVALKVYNLPQQLQSAVLRFNLQTTGIELSQVAAKKGQLDLFGDRLVYRLALNLNGATAVIDTLYVPLQKATASQITLSAYGASLNTPALPWYPVNAFDARIERLP